MDPYLWAPVRYDNQEEGVAAAHLDCVVMEDG